MNVRVDGDDPFSNINTSPSKAIGRAGRWLLAALGIVAAWALLVPLDSAVVAPFNIESSERNLLLQHISGGTVKRVRARDGDLVEEGEVIVELDPAIDQARLTKLRARHTILSALRSRLIAQRDGSDQLLSPVFEPTMQLRLGNGELLDLEETASFSSNRLEQTLNEEQSRELMTGRRALNAQLRGLEDRMQGQSRNNDALQIQIRQVGEIVALLNEQLVNARSLANAGYLPRQQVWELETRKLETASSLARLRAQLATGQGAVGETKAEIERLRMTDIRETSSQLTDVIAELEQISDELTAAEQARRQSVIRAPSRGYVVRLAVPNAGGVIRAGDTIAEIVPADGALDALARVSVSDVSAVFVGQRADVQVSALNPRVYDHIPAEITYVAADATMDERTGQRYFEVRASLNTDGLPDDLLTPGMAGSIFIRGASRTFVSYLLQPVKDGFSRTFREVN